MAAVAVIHKLPEERTCFSAAGAGVLGSVLSVVHAVCLLSPKAGM